MFCIMISLTSGTKCTSCGNIIFRGTEQKLIDCCNETVCGRCYTHITLGNLVSNAKGQYEKDQNGKTIRAKKLCVCKTINDKSNFLFFAKTIE